ncbi:MAG: hypothetical protein DCC65_04220 [Planctomycetota bacterium]|nr:MAG: hypothetical protein DCC65_04220 [Planctomycetota bacterium]
MKRICIIACVVFSLGGAGLLAYIGWPRSQAYYSDADTIREPAAVATIREILWKPPAALPDIINTPVDDYEPRLTADGNVMYFVRGKPGHNADIFFCRRTPNGWSAPEPLAPVNSDDDDLGPELSPDGSALYFYSDRPGGLGGYDLWVAHLGDNGWQTPINLGSHVNSDYNDYGPALSSDGRSLVFASNRPRDPRAVAGPREAWQATLREDPYRHDYDLYVASLSDAGLSQASPLAMLNTPHNDGSPAFSPAGDFLYFASDRPGGAGGYDLYRARRVRGDFEAPVSLGGAVNTVANELDPALEMGGYALHFSSDRPKSAAVPLQSSAGPDYDIYRTVSREVFREIEVQHARIDWAALWAQIGPNLLMAILALLLIALLLALLRDFRQRRLSLLARCLLASLLVHLLLMLLFNVVEVTTSLASAFRRSSRIQVSLASPAMAGELAAQVRGELTAVDMPPAEAPPLDRQEFSVDLARETPLAEVRVEPVAESAREAPSYEAVPAESRVVATDAPPPSAVDSSPPSRPFEVDAPIDVARLEADEARVQIVPRPEDLVSVERETTPYPTTQPATDLRPVEIQPETSNAAALTDAQPRWTDPRVAEAPSRPVENVFSIPDAGAPPENTGLVLDVPQDAPREARGQIETELAIPESNAAVNVHPGSRAALPPAAPLENLPMAVLTPSRSEPVRDASSMVDSTASAPAEFTAPPNLAALSTNPPVSPDIFDSPMLEVSLPAAEYAVAPSDEREPQVHIPDGLSPLSVKRTAPVIGVQSVAPKVVSMAPNFSDTTGDDRRSMVDTSAAASTIAPEAHPPNEAPGNAALPESLGAVDIDLGLPSEIAAPARLADGAIGIIRGRVTDAATKQPLASTKIQLDLADHDPVIAVTDDEGNYALHAPQVPDHFALTATRSGYLPQARNVPAGRLRGRVLDVDFDLQPVSEFVIAIEKDPVVHHLGNDLFEGRINSQFQRESEGTRFRASFELSAEQLAPKFRTARVELLAKGVQCPHQIRINSRRLPRRLGNSPPDGSFGRFTADFDASILRPGRNTFTLRNVTCREDIDDFEFVNVQIRLIPESAPSRQASPRDE